MDQIYAALKSAGHGLTTRQMADATGLSLEEIEQALTESLTGGGDDAFWSYDIGQDLGACPLCGWMDGRGVMICHDNIIHGPLYHYNSPAKFRSTLNPSQLSLQESVESNGDWYCKDEDIDRMRKLLHDIVTEDCMFWNIGSNNYAKCDHRTKEDAIEAYLRQFSFGYKLERGYTIRHISRYTWDDDTIFPGFSCENYFLQKPHECGGFAYVIGEGKILACTKCDCRIVYVDHGIRGVDDSW